MSFITELDPFNTLTTTHCDNFNGQYDKLLQNTKINKETMGDLTNLLTTDKTSMVNAINEVKNSITSSTNINTMIDGKVSIHNNSDVCHNDIRNSIQLLQEQINNVVVDVSWDSIQDKPTEFPPSSHGHSEYAILENREINFNNNDMLGYDDTANQFYSSPDGTSTKNYFYDTGNKPTKADVGLSEVANYPISSNYAHNSDAHYASLSAVYGVFKRLYTNDTRYEDYPPSYYTQECPRSMLTEFKTPSVLGITGYSDSNIRYVYLETRVPWTSITNSHPVTQTAYLGDEVFRRKSLDENTWSAWKGSGGEVSKYYKPTSTLQVDKPTERVCDHFDRVCVVANFIPKYSGLIRVSVDIMSSSTTSAAYLHMLGAVPEINNGGSNTYYKFRRSNPSYLVPDGTVIDIYLANQATPYISTSTGDWQNRDAYIQVEAGIPVGFLIYVGTSGTVGRVKNFKIYYDEVSI